MSNNTKKGPNFESLVRELFIFDGGRRAYDFEISMKEFGAIGRVIVHWAFLEYALYYRTKAFTKRAKVAIPKNARNFSFSKRLSVLRELMLMTIRDQKTKERWLNLISRIANAEGKRHRIAHGLWSYDPTRIERLWTHSANTNSQRAFNFDFISLGEFGLSIGELSYELLNPRPGSGRPPKDLDLPFAYASRQFRLVLEGKDPGDLGFPLPIPATPEPPPESSGE